VVEDAVDLLRQLVAIDSVNPTLVQGGAGESAIAAFIADWATAEGLEAERLEAAEGRPSVIVRARGSGNGRTLLLCGHIDTVGVEGMTEPHSPRIDGDRLYGRGAYDMKAGVAAALIACREAARTGLAGDVVVAAVADEEHSSIGVQEALRAVRADAAIVTEPTELELVVAHKGFVWAEVEVTGRSAHGSRPHLGVDAIAKMGPVLVALKELDERVQAGRKHPLVGPGSLHASLIEGGQEFSSYPARCLLTAERRWIPGETLAEVQAQLREAVGEAGEFRLGISREPFETPPDDPFVQLVARVSGDSEPGGVSYWADSGLIAAAGIPTVLFGPIGEGAHAEVEWVDLDSVERVRDVVLAVAAEWCA
jgi:acetylornithine deacetylase